jgi:arsenate reductase-like glutaredoxin family protein
MKMDLNTWTLIGKSGNPSYQVAKTWLINHGIPFEDRSIYMMKKEEIEKLSEIVPGGAKSLVYPNAFSFLMMNPQKPQDQALVEDIQKGTYSNEEIINLLVVQPYLLIAPIVTNFDKVMIGYQYEELVTTFRYFKVRDVYMA